MRLSGFCFALLALFTTTVLALSVCALPFGKLPARFQPKIPPAAAAAQVGLKRGRQLRNRYSIPHCEPATITVSAPAVVFTHFQSSTPTPRATLTASVVDSIFLTAALLRRIALHHLYSTSISLASRPARLHIPHAARLKHSSSLPTRSS